MSKLNEKVSGMNKTCINDILMVKDSTAFYFPDNPSTGAPITVADIVYIVLSCYYHCE